MTTDLVIGEHPLAVVAPDPEVASGIVVAKQFPRDPVACVEKATRLACCDAEIARSCFYKLPRAKKQIVGPSIRLAEIMATSWENLRAGARVIEIGDTYLTAEAVCQDLENNVAFRVETRRRIRHKPKDGQTAGDRYNDDMIGVTADAAISVAFRNAVFRAIPRSYVNQVYERAMDVALGRATSMKERRANLVAFWDSKGVAEKEILAHLGYKKIEQVEMDDVEYLLGIWGAIKEGDATIESAFREPRDGGTTEHGELDLGGIKGHEEADSAPATLADGGLKESEMERRGQLREEIAAALPKKLSGRQFDKITDQVLGKGGDVDKASAAQLESVLLLVKQAAREQSDG